METAWGGQTGWGKPERLGGEGNEGDGFVDRDDEAGQFEFSQLSASLILRVNRSAVLASLAKPILVKTASHQIHQSMAEL